MSIAAEKGAKTKKEGGGASPFASPFLVALFVVVALVTLHFFGFVPSSFAPQSPSEGRASANGKARDTTAATFPGVCGCFDAAASVSSPLLRRLSITPRGTIGGAVAEGWTAANNSDGTSVDGRRRFNDRLKEVLAITSPLSSEEGGGRRPVSECVRTYALPHRIAGPRELLAFMRGVQDRAARCHVWVLDTVVNTTIAPPPQSEAGSAHGDYSGYHDDSIGWSQGAWGGVKELLDHQTLAGEGGVLATEGHVGLLLIRSEGSTRDLRELGVPSRVGFVTRPLRRL